MRYNKGTEIGVNTMNKKTFDIAVIGAGPAGLSAAYEAAVSGAKVCIIDENKVPGGQLFKQIHKFFGSKTHHAGTRGFRIAEKLVQNVKDSGVAIYLDTIAWGLFPGFRIGITIADDRSMMIEAKKVIIATGASENTLAFPNSTLPGIIGAGAAQTLMNIRKVRPGKKAVVVGSGNVGLIVSYQLMQAGVDVVALVEAAPTIGGYLVHASKIRRAGVPILTKTTIVEAYGETGVEKVTIANVDENFKPIAGTERDIDTDLVCIAVGLHPMTDLCWMLGCEFAFSGLLGGHVPRHNCDMETSIEGLYIAGDVSGIEEASIAIEEGKLAGVKAAAALGFMPGRMAQELSAQMTANMAELRSGAHGEKIAECKKQVMGG